MKHSYLKLFLLCLCLSIGTNTFAYDAEIDGIYYDFFLGEAYVTYRYSLGGSYSGDITIPSSVTYKGTTYSVKNIGYRAFYSCRISSIKLPNSVMTIGGQAFAGCSLTSVIIPNSVTTIGERAFSFCRGLTSITMGYGVTSIGEYAFDSCYDLEKVIVPDIAAWCRINFDGYSSSNPIYESNHLYSDETTEITELIIPEGVKTINSNAFTGCWSLTSVTIPNSVNSIGSFSFSDCRYLTSAIIGNGVTSIGVAAFDGCSSLTSLTIPSSVTSIGNNAFGGTAWLNNQPDGLVYAGKVAYCYKGTMPDGTHIAIKEGTTEIAAYAFANCSGLTSVNIPISVTSIDRSAFAACSGLTSVIMNNPIPVSIEEYTFSNRANATLYVPFGSRSSYKNASYWEEFKDIKEIRDNIPEVDGISYRIDSEKMVAEVVYLPDDNKYTGDIIIPSSITYAGQTYSVTGIGKKAFYDCDGLTSITLPRSLTSIGNYVFSGCCCLTSVIMKRTTPVEVNEWTFNGFDYKNAILYVPYGCRTAYNAASFWAGFKEIREFAPEVDGIYYNLDEEKMVAEVIPVPDNGKYSGDIIIPSSIIYDGETYSVTSIGHVAFYYCKSLTSITIPESVTSIGEYAFSYCDGLTSVNIPEGVTSIGVEAFLDCGFCSVTIPESVTTIGHRAFYSNCLSTLTVKWQTPPAIDKNTFPNRVDISLFVPKGSAAAYEAAPYWKEFKDILKGYTDFAEMDNVIYLEGSEAIADGGMATLTLKMKNSVTAEGFHFDMYLPDGCSFALDEEGETDVELSYKRATLSSMYFEHVLNADGSLNVTVSSRKGKVITGNDGAVVLIRIIVDEGMAIENHPIILKNWGVSDNMGWVWPESENDPVAYPLNILDIKRGDVNGDKAKKINSGDYTTLTHYILNLPYRQINMLAADANGDGRVDVADLSAIAEIIKKQSQQENK